MLLHKHEQIKVGTLTSSCNLAELKALSEQEGNYQLCTLNAPTTATGTFQMWKPQNIHMFIKPQRRMFRQTCNQPQMCTGLKLACQLSKLKNFYSKITKGNTFNRFESLHCQLPSRQTGVSRLNSSVILETFKNFHVLNNNILKLLEFGFISLMYHYKLLMFGFNKIMVCKHRNTLHSKINVHFACFIKYSFFFFFQVIC